jgi:hypothetical protein
VGIAMLRMKIMKQTKTQREVSLMLPFEQKERIEIKHKGKFGSIQLHPPKGLQ